MMPFRPKAHMQCRVLRNWLVGRQHDTDDAGFSCRQPAAAVRSCIGIAHVHTLWRALRAVSQHVVSSMRGAVMGEAPCMYRRAICCVTSGSLSD